MITSDRLRSDKASNLDQILFLIILIAGIILRFYNYGHIPFVHDEISTLYRACYNQYNSFGEFIEKATKSDVHPPGLLIFIRYWVKFFGDSPQAVKFPFVVAGILSIFFAYKIAGQWFNQTTALLTAVVVSASEYTINYTIIARPYALGILCCLIFVYCQWNYFSKEKRKNLWLTGFIISGIFCIYLHYFSLLVAFIVAVTGIFICEKSRLKFYLIACFIIALSFLPFSPIVFYHLKITAGEQTWIGKPTLGFIARFFFFLFHYSWWYFTTLILILGILYFGKEEINSRQWKRQRWISFVFFSIPFIIGFLISVFASPVLEFSSLIFGFAFLPMFIFSLGKELKAKWKGAVVMVLLLVSILTLVFERKHYELYYSQGINKLITEIKDSKRLIQKDSCDYYINVEKYFIDYYSKKTNNADVNIISILDSKDVNTLKKRLQTLDKKYLAFGSVTTYPTEILSVIENKYPFLVRKYTGLLTEYYLFSKEKPLTGAIDEIIFSDEENFRAKKDNWIYDNNNVLMDSSVGNSCLLLNANNQLVFEKPLRSMMKNYSDIVNISAEVYTKDVFPSATLELITQKKGKVLGRRIVNISDYVKPGEWSKVFLSCRFTDIAIDFKRADLKVTIHNSGNIPLKISSMKITVKKGNPYLYGMSFD